MKELSLFLLKNSLTSKMRKGFKNFCNGDGSTSTLNQQKNDVSSSTVPRSSAMDSPNYLLDEDKGRQPTLEEMILQLELEEKLAARTRAELEEEEEDDDDDDQIFHQQQHNRSYNHRMSCVNSSDILRSLARNALDQYPRFSLDGKDAMYRSSFTKFKGPKGCATGTRRCCSKNELVLRKTYGLTNGNHIHAVDSDADDVTSGHRGRRQQHLPAKIGGERVVWCKAGVVAKLMGLEAMPIPVVFEKISNYRKKQQKQLMSRNRADHQYWRRGVVFDDNTVGRPTVAKTIENLGGYCKMNKHPVKKSMPPVEVPNIQYHEATGWPLRRF